MTDTTAHHETHGRIEHETSDVSAQASLLFIGTLGIVLVLITAGLWMLFKSMAAEQAKLKESRFPLARAERQLPLAEHLPPAPRLEGLEPGSLIRSGVAGWPSLGPAQRERDELALSKYGWADAKAGIAEIPVERAIDLLAGKLPVRKDAVAPGAEARKDKP